MKFWKCYSNQGVHDKKTSLYVKWETRGLDRVLQAQVQDILPKSDNSDVKMLKVFVQNTYCKTLLVLAACQNMQTAYEGTLTVTPGFKEQQICFQRSYSDDILTI